ncbi:general secretion pathway protein K [Desulfuromusa kysingii]|uniref:General secretion pathway protein K n=1 Tax=Desulfuromusa kysingii TaxID=37625 RepID=A0A1H3W2Y6_9BACT|nr:type II secretion system minor pseudopilin GspK [Desulfuromusa kysingii]SDZ81416.1 general secretion pathway protein K [Desulfuromusa kysingii]
MERARNQNGMALLLVLVIVALLSAMVIEFSFSTLVDLRSTEIFRDRTKAVYLARGGIEAARTILQEDDNDFDHPAEFWGNPLANIPAGDGDVSITITDLTGRLNINFVADKRGNPLPGYHRFVALCEDVLLLDSEQAEELADSLVYWFNADKTKTTPDDSYYANLHPPYQRRGDKLTIIDELMLVKGFDLQRFETIKPYIRVVGGEPINLNTAPAAVLYAWQFSAAEGNVEVIFDQKDIAALVDYRQQSVYQTLSDLALAEGIGERWSSAWMLNSVTVSGTVYQVFSQGRVNEGTRQASAVIDKQTNELLSLKVE